MRKTIILLPVTSFFLVSCSNSTTEKSNWQIDTAAQEEHLHNTETQIIELNNTETI